MRASLASATPLLVLLLLVGHNSAASPIIAIGQTTPFYYVPDNTRGAGTDTANPVNALENYVLTPLPASDASLTRGNAGVSPYLVAGQSALAKLAALNAPIANASDTNLPALRTTLGPGGGVGAGNSVFVGTSDGLALLDIGYNYRAGASASFGYGFTPARDAHAPREGVPQTDSDEKSELDGPLAMSEPGRTTQQPASPDPDHALSRVGADDAHAINRPGDGMAVADPTWDNANASVSLVPAPAASRGNVDSAVRVKPNAVARPGHGDASVHHGPPAAAPAAAAGTVNSDGNVSLPLANPSNATPSGRAFVTSVPGATVFGTNEPRAKGPAGSATPPAASNPLRDEAIKAFYLSQQSAADPAVQGGDVAAFNIASSSDGTVVTPAATVSVPIAVIATGNGELPSSLTIFTPESTASAGEGDTFTYYLDRGLAR